MLRHSHFAGTRRFAVEVSGWDSAQSFFVEKCDLVWNEDSSKHVALKRNLRGNATLFVRLLETGAADPSHPVVYEAELLGSTESGLLQFRLSTIVPRAKESECSVA